MTTAERPMPAAPPISDACRQRIAEIVEASPEFTAEQRDRIAILWNASTLPAAGAA
jgi:hypothetical protein